MAETGEIPGWVAGVAAAGTFVGGALAAIFGRKRPEPQSPEKPEDSMDAWKRRVDQALASQGARLDRGDVDRGEFRSDLGRVYEKLDELTESNARIEGALGIQRGGAR